LKSFDLESSIDGFKGMNVSVEGKTLEGFVPSSFPSFNLQMVKPSNATGFKTTNLQSSIFLCFKLQTLQSSDKYCNLQTLQPLNPAIFNILQARQASTRQALKNKTSPASTPHKPKPSRNLSTIPHANFKFTCTADPRHSCSI
jgi:hypothetical protein